MKRNLLILLVCGALLAFLMSPAYATTCDTSYYFQYVSGDMTNAPEQTFMRVTDDFTGYTAPMGANVMFEFTTEVSPGAIVQIGFYDDEMVHLTGTFLGSGSVGTVNMPQDGTPQEIPGFDPPGGYFDNTGADVYLSFTAVNPQVDNGVGAGEALALFFDGDCDAIIAALNLAVNDIGPYDGSHPFPDDALAVAIKIAGLPGSTEAVNVPLPPSALLMGSGLLGLGLVGWRRRSQQA
ncbi:MAG: hypothetical protein P8075_21735 [Deltaproteobacteria bacterium]|jgi:hypothetical protein